MSSAAIAGGTTDTYSSSIENTIQGVYYGARKVLSDAAEHDQQRTQHDKL